MAERKPGFDYFFSKSLNMEVAVSKSTGVLYTEDKIKYTPDELNIINATGENISLPVHIVKKYFDGVLIDIHKEEENGNRLQKDEN